MAGDTLSITNVSIRAPREGRDKILLSQKHFKVVSIRAPREGRDVVVVNVPTAGRGFNPRAPRGARPNSELIPA